MRLSLQQFRRRIMSSAPAEDEHQQHKHQQGKLAHLLTNCMSKHTGKLFDTAVRKYTCSASAAQALHSPSLSSFQFLLARPNGGCQQVLRLKFASISDPCTFTH